MPVLTKEKIDYFEAIQLISLSNLYNLRNNKPTTREYDFNRIFRVYSKTYHTPLHVVKGLPLHHVLTAYYDDLFESMEQDDLEEVRLDLLKSQEERAEIKDADEASLLQDMADLVKEAEAAVGKIAELGKAKTAPLISHKGDVPLVNPVMVDKPKPEIKMSFLSPEEMSKILERDDSLGLLEP